jgi:putative effector of murein hydrolase
MSVDWIDLLIGVVLGGILGGIISWSLSNYFNQKQAMTDTLMLRALENAGFVEFYRNDMGKMAGTVRHGAIQAFVESAVMENGFDIKGIHDQ